MERYIAFLRGINISGKNKIPMNDLKAVFEKLGFSDIRTYLNSGNVAFSGNQNDTVIISRQIEQMLKDAFGFDIPVFVISRDALEDILRYAPDWWGTENKEVYDNIIFILPPTTFDDVFYEIGAPKDGLEQIFNYKQAIFWSFSRADYQKTNWWSKTAGANIGGRLTIRTAGTVRKICKM